MAKIDVDSDWETIKQNALNGTINRREIVECMRFLNIRDQQKIIHDTKKYISARGDWSYVLKGKNWRDLYYQHFPKGEDPWRQ